MVVAGAMQPIAGANVFSMKALISILASNILLGLLATPAEAQTLHSFQGAPNDGAQPSAGLTNVNGVLYGTTYLGGTSANNGGTIFKITTAGAESVLHSFGTGSDGTGPVASLLNVNGVLYGTTVNGGTNCLKGGGCGTVFRITTDGVESVLHSFGSITNDGAFPYAGLTSVNGELYGTTQYGGTGHCQGGAARGCGTVFKITPEGVETVLYSFKGGKDGSNPTTGLLNVGGVLYGTTGGGGESRNGTVYKITRTGIETVLYSFKGNSPPNNDGAYPSSGLIAVGSILYGTTSEGGTGAAHNCPVKGCGTLFQITTTGVEKVLFSFGGSSGTNPGGGLIDIGGVFYGTAPSGGNFVVGNCFEDGCGVVFKVTTSGVETVLANFAYVTGSPTGAYPMGALVNVGGVLYGTTGGGGTSGDGTVFAVTP